MNSDQTSTGSSNKYNNNTTNIATSTPTAQGPYRTQTGPVQGGSYSRQGGGHDHHGPTGLHQQSTNITTGHQHLQSTPQGPHLLP